MYADRASSDASLVVDDLRILCGVAAQALELLTLRTGDEAGEAVIDWVNRFIPNFRADIREWKFLSPWDIEQRTGITDGAIRHLNVVPGQFLGERPGYDTPIGNFYLCGGGTHPAGEVTGAPGHNAAHHILQTYP